MAKFAPLTNSADGETVYVNAEQIMFLQVRDPKKSPTITVLSFADGLRLNISASPTEIFAAIGKAERGHP